MSYLSTTENVGFGGTIPQNISDASCATQYKMGVDGVSANSDVNIFIHDSSGDEQTYIPHLNDNFFHSKFKIDPNELYTFHDSDVIAGEITVSHTEDNYVFSDDVKSKFLESPIKDFDVDTLTNGSLIKPEINTEIVQNGHYSPTLKVKPQPKAKEGKTIQKSAKGKNQVSKEPNKTNVNENHLSVHSHKGQNSATPVPSSKTSISSVNTNNHKDSPTTKQINSQTFLDAFKKHIVCPPHTIPGDAVVKTEPKISNDKIPVPVKTLTPSKTQIAAKTATPAKTPNLIKTPNASGKKIATAKPSSSKPKRGRGPAVHEALQRISSQNRAIPVPNRAWHAPGIESYTFGPLDERCGRKLDNSSSDDDCTPDIDSGYGPVCVEEWSAESRGARLALRRAALRRQAARAQADLRLSSDNDAKPLLGLIKRQLRGQGLSTRLPTQVVNHLLAERGMTALMTSQERRQLRQAGWSGGESGATEYLNCIEEHCTKPAVPCAKYCLSHITLATDQRLYASCAAVFAGGARCKQPLLPLQDHTPLCAEHAWKRDNYDKLTQQHKRKKPAPPRRRVAARPRRPRAPPAQHEVSICSNSSTYDSSEETQLGALSDTEYIVAPAPPPSQHDLEVSEVEVGAVPAEDILDPSVLGQMPDVAFTEFFNQGGAAFAESSELAAALEAVLDERGLDERVLEDSIEYTDEFVATAVKNKIPVTTSVSMDMSTGAPS